MRPEHREYIMQPSTKSPFFKEADGGIYQELPPAYLDPQKSWQGLPATALTVELARFSKDELDMLEAYFTGNGSLHQNSWIKTLGHFHDPYLQRQLFFTTLDKINGKLQDQNLQFTPLTNDADEINPRYSLNIVENPHKAETIEDRIAAASSQILKSARQIFDSEVPYKVFSQLLSKSFNGTAMKMSELTSVIGGFKAGVLNRHSFTYALQGVLTNIEGHLNNLNIGLDIDESEADHQFSLAFSQGSLEEVICAFKTYAQRLAEERT